MDAGLLSFTMRRMQPKPVKLAEELAPYPFLILEISTDS